LIPLFPQTSQTPRLLKLAPKPKVTDLVTDFHHVAKSGKSAKTAELRVFLDNASKRGKIGIRRPNMDGWDIAIGITNIVQRLPIERLFQRDKNKDFEKFEQGLKEKGWLTEPATLRYPAAISNAEPAHFGGLQVVPTKVVNRVGLGQETLAYQEQLTHAELYLTEGYAKEDFMG
jgi:hypothetical protein